MDKKLIFAGAFGLLFLGVLVWFLFFRKNPTTNTTIIQVGKKDDKKPAQPPKTVTNTVYVNGGGGGNARNDNFPLKQGSYGEKVKQIQAKLKISADGDWGQGTQAALVKAGITSGFSDQAALDKWLNPTSTPDTASTGTTAVATMNGGYQRRDPNHEGTWGNDAYVDVYEDAYTTSKVVNGFQGYNGRDNATFYGLGVVKNNFLYVQYGGKGKGKGRGWILLSKLKQVKTKSETYFAPFDEENEENQRKRNTRKRY